MAAHCRGALAHADQPVPAAGDGLAGGGSAPLVHHVDHECAAVGSHVTGQPDRITDVLVQAADGVEVGELRKRIRGVVGDGVEAITGDDLVDERLESLGFSP